MKIFKHYILIPFFVLMFQQVVKADEQIGQESLILSQAQAVLLEDLDNERGRGGVDITSLSKSNVGATLRSNTAIDNTTGFNSINDSIKDNSGITGVVLNSGNNVIIQNSTTINVTLIP